MATHVLISETDFTTLLKNIVVNALKENQAPAKPDNSLLTQMQAAEMLKISIPTLISWKDKNIVPFIKVGRKVFFKKHDLLTALEGMKSKTTLKG